MIKIAAVPAAAIALAPLTHADPPPSAGAGDGEATVQQLYMQVQSTCTPRTPPNFQRIVWNGNYFNGDYGTGRIIDANPSLGGPFTIMWSLGPGHPLARSREVPSSQRGYWDINLEFC